MKQKLFIVFFLIGILKISNGQSVLDLYANYNTIGVNVKLNDADIEKDAVGILEYKEVDEGTWKMGFPLSRVDNDLNVLSGSVFWCTPNTAYDIRVTINDATTSVLNGQLLTGTTQTRQEVQVPSPIQTLYVSPGGLGDFTEAQPGNLQDALDLAEAGTKIILTSGNYYVGDLTISNNGTATNPIQIVGAPDGTSILNGSYEDPLVWTPYGNQGVWRTNTPAINPNLIIADGIRLYPHQTYTDLRNDQITLLYLFCFPLHIEPAGISGFYRNPTGLPIVPCNFGDPQYINNHKLYIKFLDNSNPNDKEIHVTNQAKCLKLNNNAHIYFKGLTFQYYGLGSEASALIIDNSSDITIDSCFFDANNTGIRLNHDSKNITITNTEFKDYFVNWHAWKVKATQDAGAFSSRFPDYSRYIEKGGIMVGNDFYGRGIVIKNNKFSGFHQAGHIAPKMISILDIEDTLRRSFEIDFYNNELTGVTGDFELDGHSRNIRVFNNHFSHIHTFSVAPAQDGPTYIMRNVFDDIITDEYFYNSSLHQAKGQPLKFQYGDTSTTSRNGDIFFFHNTINTGNIAFGMYFNQTAIPDVFKRFVSKNNIIVNDSGIDLSVRTLTYPNFERSHNGYFSNNTTIAEIDTNNTGGQNFSTISELYSSYGWDENSLQSDPLFIDATNGDYHLSDSSPMIDAGIILVGINADAYFGTSPDIGAFEWDGPTNIPEENEDHDIIVFPNPVLSDGNLIIKIKNYQGGKLFINNLQGQRVYSQMLKQEVTNINIKELHAGVYFVVINIDNKIIAKKIVKN